LVIDDLRFLICALGPGDELPEAVSSTAVEEFVGIIGATHVLSPNNESNSWKIGIAL
jgi:hypothetical protein